MTRRRPTSGGGAWVLAACLALAGGPAVSAERLAVVVYPGYGTPAGFVVEGRVIEARRVAQATRSDRWWQNLWRNLRRLVNDEGDGVPVTVALGAQTWSTVSDDEGYFRVEGVPAPGATTGWRAVSAQVRGAVGTGEVLLVPRGNTLGIISDVDDTILVSEVADKPRLLANTLLKNPLQREAVKGVAPFYARLVRRDPHPDAAPVFYLSASPRQFHRNIQEFLGYAGFPRGVLITKKVTDDATGEPLFAQRAYKIAHIEALLRCLPNVRFVLVGDDGEQDPESYHEIQARFPGRIAAVYIRRVNRDPGRARFPNQRDLMRAVAAASRQAWSDSPGLRASTAQQPGMGSTHSRPLRLRATGSNQ